GDPCALILLFRILNGDQVKRLIVQGTGRAGTGDSPEYADIVQLPDRSIDAKPVDTLARNGVNDPDPTPGFFMRFSKPLLQLKAREVVVARTRYANKSVLVMKSQAAHESRTKG